MAACDSRAGALLGSGLWLRHHRLGAGRSVQCRPSYDTGLRPSPQDPWALQLPLPPPEVARSLRGRSTGVLSDTRAAVTGHPPCARRVTTQVSATVLRTGLDTAVPGTLVGHTTCCLDVRCGACDTATLWAAPDDLTVIPHWPAMHLRCIPRSPGLTTQSRGHLLLSRRISPPSG